MTDTPGWASPGSAPSDGQEPAASGPTPPQDPANGPDQGGADGPEKPKWSKEQPPPAQWSAPTPQNPGQASPPPPPGPGWGGAQGGAPGGHPGWGGPGYGGPGYGAPGHGWGGPGWGGPPPSEKPGVIPLRPLGIGEILDGAVSTMRTYWRTVLGIALAVSVVVQTGVVLLQGLVLNDSVGSEALNDPNATLDEVTDALGATFAGTGLVVLISLLGTIVATALLTSVTSRAVLGKPVTTAEAWREARPQLLRLFGLTFLLPLIAFVVIMIGLLPGILLGLGGGGDAADALTIIGGVGAAAVAVWLVVRLTLASPALMLEKQGIRKALSRSAKLVRGSWWRVFGIQLLAAIIANILASIIVIPFTFIGAAVSSEGFSAFLESSSNELGWTFLIVSGIGSVIGSMLTFPISAGVTVLLYIDQRIRREALDLDLARAAGLPDYGTGVPGTTPGS